MGGPTAYHFPKTIKTTAHTTLVMISVGEMKRLEDVTVKKGISRLTLMETSGSKVAVSLGTDIFRKNVAVFCGDSDNGGIGFVAARALAFHCKVTVLFVGQEDKLSPESRINLQRIARNGRIKIIKSTSDFDKNQDFVIDSLMGIEYTGEPMSEAMKKAIMQFNLSTGVKICVDVPSGMNAETGEVAELSCSADKIIALHDMKKGLVKFKDKIVSADIGIRP